jgi:GH15 family glucan-1,4-alpha-glucosidase
MLEDIRSKMWEMSKQVLRDSALSNGALVAANGLFLPPTATPYHFVWGRDAAKQLLAAYALGMEDASEIREKFLSWILRCCPGTASNRLFIKRNHINGPNDFLYNDDLGFQPDNNGALISAIDATRSRKNSVDNEVIRLLANGLTDQWDIQTRCFTMRQQDLWENATIDVIENNFFTHALLVAAHGLLRASTSLASIASKAETTRWSLISTQMYEHVCSVTHGKRDCFYKRLYSTVEQPNQLDAALALVLPDLLPPNAPDHTKRLAANTIVKIGEELLWLPYGARRYDGDKYDGIERLDGSQATGGAWPLLGYAWVRAAQAIGRHEAARKAHDALDLHLGELYKTGIIPEYRIPEQIHPAGDSRNGKGPMHFAWGGAEWALAEADRRKQQLGKG